MKHLTFKHTSIIYAVFAAMLLPVKMSASDSLDIPDTTKKERNFIKSGNEAFNANDYESAIELYNRALEINPNNPLTRYNLATAMMFKSDAQKGAQGNSEQVTDPHTGLNDNTSNYTIAQVKKIYSELAQCDYEEIREKSLYNLGNLYYTDDSNPQNISRCIACYQAALRINPQNDKARDNLRRAQLKRQNQNENQNQNQDQQNDQNNEQDKQEQQQQQQQQQQQEQNKQQQQQQQQPRNMSQESAEQMLKAVEAAEAETRKEQADKERRPIVTPHITKPW